MLDLAKGMITALAALIVIYVGSKILFAAVGMQ